MLYQLPKTVILLRIRPAEDFPKTWESPICLSMAYYMEADISTDSCTTCPMKSCIKMNSETKSSVARFALELSSLGVEPQILA